VYNEAWKGERREELRQEEGREQERRVEEGRGGEGRGCKKRQEERRLELRRREGVGKLRGRERGVLHSRPPSGQPGKNEGR
jgi:hypothetical protein